MQLSGFRHSDWGATIVAPQQRMLVTSPDPFLPPPTNIRKVKGRLRLTSHSHDRNTSTK